MIVRHFLTDNNESNVFVAVCPETSEAIIVDAGACDPAIVGFIEQCSLKPAALFITHDHYDHTEGLAQFVQRFGVEVYAGSSRAGGRPATAVTDGSEIAVGRLTGRVFAVPGHTQDSVCLAFPGHVFTGDALFAGSIGGTGGESAKRQLIDGITRKLFSLPHDTALHPGHGPSSTVSIESRFNPFFV